MASVPGMVTAHRARDKQLVALCTDAGWVCSLWVHNLQDASVPAPAQLPTTRLPPHAAQTDLGRSLLNLWSLGLHRQLGQRLWRGETDSGSFQRPGPKNSHP
jgi:hypothetical protein